MRLSKPLLLYGVRMWSLPDCPRCRSAHQWGYPDGPVRRGYGGLCRCRNCGLVFHWDHRRRRVKIVRPEGPHAP